jgi:hypothetical protein
MMHRLSLGLFILLLIGAVGGGSTPITRAQPQPDPLVVLAQAALPHKGIVSPGQTDIPPLPTDIQGRYLFPNQFLAEWKQWSDADTVTIFRCTSRAYADCVTVLTLQEMQQGTRTATIAVQPHQFISFMELRSFDEKRSYQIYYAVAPFETPDYTLQLPIIEHP